MAGKTLGRDRFLVEKYREVRRFQRNSFDNLSFHVLRQKLFGEPLKSYRCSICSLGIRRQDLQGKPPFTHFLRPCFLVKNHPCGKIFLLSVNGKALAGGERGELANTELTDPVALEDRRL